MSWSRSLSEFADEQEKRLNAELRAKGLQALTGVIERSPVKSGRFRGNHQVTVGGETDEVLDREDKSGRTTLADGRRIIEGIKKPFTYIVVQNNLSYSETIELGGFTYSPASGKTTPAGYSVQAPTGVYAVTFNNLKESFRR